MAYKIILLFSKENIFRVKNKILIFTKYLLFAQFYQMKSHIAMTDKFPA